jgi:ATP-dependent Clp protease ATP-binding subunit ClpB
LGADIIREKNAVIAGLTRNPLQKAKILEETKNEVLDLLKKTIRPEFLNRMDETIMFTPLDESEIKEIVQMQLNGVKKQLAENGIDLQFTEAAIELISEEGYDPQFGARPVKRVIQRQVLNPLSKDILARRINQSNPIVIDAVEKQLTFSN